MKWENDCLWPKLGKEIEVIITVEPGDKKGLFTFRGGKDTDLTAKQFRSLADACVMAASRIDNADVL